MTAYEKTRRMVLASVLGILCATGAAFAQQVSWANPGPLGAGQRATLDLVFDNTQPKGAVHLPAIDGLSVVGTPSESTRMSIVNGQRSDSVTLSYPVRADREGHIVLPAFEVNTTDGPYSVAAISVDVGAAMLPGRGRQGGTLVSDAVSARMLPSTQQPYAGQVFDVDVVVSLRNGQRGEVVGTPEWTSPDIESEVWSKGHPTSTADGSAVRFRTHAVASKPGTITLAPAQQDVRVAGGRSDKWDDFFSMPDFAMPKFSIPNFSMPDLSDFFSHRGMSEVTVGTDPVELQVRPLPQPAPAGFTGAVGDFTLESKLVPEQPQAGEPVTWTLTLKGTGNWGEVQLPARAIPSDMRTLQPKQQRHFNEGDRFTGSVSEDLVLIPNRQGRLQLEPVRFVYFNPQTQQYETAIARPPTLAVAPSAAPLQQTSSAPQQAVSRAPAAAAPVAAMLPHGPLSGTGNAWLPHGNRWVFAVSSLPFGVLAGYWLVLAMRRARQTDPRRPQREAFVQMRAAIARARQAADAEQRRAAILGWQHAAAVVLGLGVAAPTAAHLRAARAGETGSDGIDRWFELWAESDRTLYGRAATLNESWYEEASALCSRIRLPRLNPLRVFLPHNLLPATATAAALVLLAVTAHADAVDAYRQGDFTAAQHQFATQVAAAPSDWVARYNLGLAAAQLGDNGKALGETAAAFALHPRNRDVRWNLQALAARLPGLDATIARVAFASGAAAFARCASPATWQAVLVLACITLCIGAAFMLRQRYRGHASTNGFRCASALLACGAIGALMAVLALRQYGPLANPGAAVVAQATTLRSVPTEAQSAQQEKPLAAGTLVVTQKNFLGWTHVVRGGGEAGWLRRTDLVPLYGGAVPS
jgi:BatD DUF11 like domain